MKKENEIIQEEIEKAVKGIEMPDDLKLVKIRSKLLDTEFSVRAVDDIYFEITHDTLERISLNYPGFSFQYKPIVCSKDHAVVECAAEYKDKCITKVGEATQGNLKGPVQWNIPASMAYMRAFDRAMIRLLCFDETVYSSMELDMTGYYEGQISTLKYKLKMLDAEVLKIALDVAKKTKERLSTPKPETKNIITISDDEDEQYEPSFVPFDDAVPSGGPFDISTENGAGNEQMRADTAKAEEITPPAYKPTADTVLLIGNCKGMKLKDAVKSSKWPSFLSWIKDIDYKSKDPKVLEQANYFKSYAKEKLK